MAQTRMYIRKNDTVVVITGKEKGKSGKVLRVIRSKGAVIVEKINIVKRHSRPTSEIKQGGIIEKEAPLYVSKVLLRCPKCNAGRRIGRKVLDDGTKVRICRKCQEVLDA
ncbi:MAG: 50S ribosomal protein L24 [Deltaproteobacteria bacterium]|nr:50S ribosomal protein L24 [Deltaproteobacteria bacterium]